MLSPPDSFVPRLCPLLHISTKPDSISEYLTTPSTSKSQNRGLLFFPVPVQGWRLRFRLTSTGACWLMLAKEWCWLFFYCQVTVGCQETSNDSSLLLCSFFFSSLGFISFPSISAAHPLNFSLGFVYVSCLESVYPRGERLSIWPALECTLVGDYSVFFHM